ncbi:PREDICTED: putative disease resistance RPP13-like protein 1 [Populus euphratica]|uniref:Disease resistance RPP13-like protein 1 n=1 Tax=Populus euphratica TaxID=75702 RepID=A0AAJ6UZN2_POPEU|nr:PREDICTED: putative disease resistance RPP13-like protein 1 [Populus euphratica]
MKKPPSRERVPSTSLLGHTRIYGRDPSKEAIKELLVPDDAEGGSLQVIPIVGMPGIGKTTLARFVYHDDDVQKWFDLKAWVSVSQDLKVFNLTKIILKEFGFLNCDLMPHNSLHCKLREILMGKKLLLVLDDFWNDDPEQCKFLITPLMAGAKGSTIIITARERSGTSLALQILHPYPLQTIHPFHLQGISSDDCWLLFSEYAFSDANRNAGSLFKEMFHSTVVRRCNGLPLAAKLLGCLLKSKTNADEWRKILNSNMWDLQDDRGLHVLKMTYYCLPQYLKQCFAYCAIFPKGYEFCKEDVVLLWMAEGFLLAYGGNKEMKEAGYRYFEDLVSMFFFEQVSDNSSLFVMHDLTNDLAKFVNGEFAVCLDDSGDSWKVSKKTRYLSYAKTRLEDLNNLVGLDEVQNLRTILVISKFFLANMNDEEINDFLRRFQRLRVLSLFHIDKLPNSIGSLKRLWYINLSGSSAHRLPETVCTLHNLQILILRGCKNLVELPSNLMNLTNLYHLDIKGTRLQQMPPQMGKLSKLQTLTDFFVGKQNGSSIKEVGELKCLEGKLRIWMLQNVVDAQDALGANLEGMRDLKKLDLRWSDDSHSSLDECVLRQLKPNVNMHCLVIIGYGGSRFPAWLIDSFLVDLRLSECQCSFLPPLGQLAYLKRLLIKAFDKVESVGYEFYGNCTSTSIAFKSLESLTFERMPQWCEWIPNVAESEEKTFPCLKVLYISECPKLKKTLPIYLPSLKELRITKCSQFVFSLPKPTTINKMFLRDSSNDYPHMLKLEILTSGWYSLIVQSCYSLDFLSKEMQQLGYFLSMQEISIHSSSLKCFPIELFPRLKQLDISECPNLESLCLSDRVSTSTSTLNPRECSNLQELSLFDCSNLKSVDCSLPSLVTLKISCCGELESFPALGLSSSPGVCLSSKLESLTIHDCQKLFARLEELDLDGFSLSSCELHGISSSTTTSSTM